MLLEIQMNSLFAQPETILHLNFKDKLINSMLLPSKELEVQETKFLLLLKEKLIVLSILSQV